MLSVASVTLGSFTVSTPLLLEPIGYHKLTDCPPRDVILIGSDPRRLGTCVRLSRMCRRTLQTNVIGLGWTIAIVILAAFGLLGGEGALVAAILHNTSTLLVLGNAARLMRYEERHGVPSSK